MYACIVYQKNNIVCIYMYMYIVRGLLVEFVTENEHV